jgi:RimJ/RimL family protein N-acetyltransferase
VLLREIRESDAESLAAHLADADVVRYLAPPPSSLAALCRFVRSARAQRRRGTRVCFSIVPANATRPVGLLQIWPVEADFSTAEWGFVVGRAFWGTGLFHEAATLLLDFAFTRMRVCRLEARAAVLNVRGNRALSKLGAVREGYLRQAFRSDSGCTDSVMWSILAGDYLARRSARPRTA